MQLEKEACQSDVARPRGCADPGKFVAANRRETRRFSASIYLPRATRGYSPSLPSGRPDRSTSERTLPQSSCD